MSLKIEGKFKGFKTSSYRKVNFMQEEFSR